ncbi:hypothetical protein MKW92_011055 [Papaver armeniacum]|nr:hypothetical protein MKW92_011055 [Papaver armeniacum]
MVQFHLLTTNILILLPCASAQSDNGRKDVVRDIAIFLGAIIIWVLFIGCINWLQQMRLNRYVEQERQRRIRVTEQQRQQRVVVPRNDNITLRRYATQKTGLDSKVIESLPVFVHPGVKNKENVLECVVFSSSTCPVCRRNLKGDVPETTLNDGDTVIDTILEDSEDQSEMETEIIQS